MNCQDAKVAKNEFLFEPDPKTDAAARTVIGEAIEAHRQLGPGFLQSFPDGRIVHGDPELALPFWTAPAERQRRRRFELGRDVWTVRAAIEKRRGASLPAAVQNLAASRTVYGEASPKRVFAN